MAAAPEGERDEVVEASPLEILRLFSSRWGILVAASVGMFISRGIVLTFPKAIQLSIDWGLAGGRRDLLYKLSVGLLGLIVLRGILMWASFTAVSWVGADVVAKLRQRILSRVLRMPPSWFAKNPVGRLTGRLASDGAALASFTGKLALVIGDAVTALIGVGLMIWSDWRLSAWSLSILPLLVLATSILGRTVQRASRRAREAEAKASATAHTALDAVSTVQVFRQEQREAGAYEAKLRDSVRAELGMMTRLGTIMGTVESGNSLVVLIVVWFGGFAVSDGRMTAGEVTGFLIYLFTVSGSLSRITNNWGVLRQVAGSTTRFVELSRLEPPRRESPAAESFPTGPWSLALRSVTYAYPDRPLQPAVTDIHLDVEPGEVVAIVGRSGAGKSTVLNLILRHVDPTYGQVLLGGLDARRLKLDDIRSAISIVPQEPVLFPGTIAENIAYGRPDATVEEIRHAAARAHALSFIERLADGFDTVVRERGSNLSGGQRQRLALARALIMDPHVLILDEATSQLDTESEEAISTAISEFAKDRCVIVVAHRLKSIRDVDRIVVMDAGRVVQEGSHAELMREHGLYRHLVSIQMSEAELEVEVTSIYASLYDGIDDD